MPTIIKNSSQLARYMRRVKRTFYRSVENSLRQGWKETIDFIDQSGEIAEIFGYMKQSMATVEPGQEYTTPRNYIHETDIEHLQPRKPVTKFVIREETGWAVHFPYGFYYAQFVEQGINPWFPNAVSVAMHAWQTSDLIRDEGRAVFSEKLEMAIRKFAASPEGAAG